MKKFLHMKKKFIDSVQICVRGGAGGFGSAKYGGIGGKGGNVYLKGGKLKDLRKFLSPKESFTGRNGGDSKKNQIIGSVGMDKFIEAPVGVVVYDENKNLIGEINGLEDTLLVAKGGLGGSAKSDFMGAKGEMRNITLDLKIIADVGLVGFPNAGKSTLLKALSRATPKIAAYPFTTLKPNLGVLEYPDLRQISVADLPGLIEGASENVGMGHSFLKHIERTFMLLMVVDIEGFQWKPSLPHRNCLETILLLNKELELYDESLIEKPAILAINKIDKPGASKKLEDLLMTLKSYPYNFGEHVSQDLIPNKILKFEKVVLISARYDKDSVNNLKEKIRNVLEEFYNSNSKRSFSKNEKELKEEIGKSFREFGDFMPCFRARFFGPLLPLNELLCYCSYAENKSTGVKCKVSIIADRKEKANEYFIWQVGIIPG